MRQLISAMLITVFAFGQLMAQSQATITVKGSKKEQGVFQKEGEYGFKRIDPNDKGEFVLTIDKFGNGRNYIYVDNNQQYNNVYITPGASVVLTETAGKTLFSGDNKEINEFINSNKYVGYTQGSAVKNYSAEWKAERKAEIKRLNDNLQKSNLDASFKNYQSLYWQFQSYKSLIDGPSDAIMFGRKGIEVPGDYYTFLKDVKFDNEMIKDLPSWWLIMKSAFERMEKEGYLPVSKDNYIQIYAEQIPNAKLRSEFIIAMLSHTLDMGYNDDFMNYIGQVNKYILPENQAQLNQIKEKYNAIAERFASLKRGTPAPEISGVDINGNPYKLSDLKGNVVVVDFWFSGCVPCKAEMPVMEKMAGQMKDQKIKFISVSLDSGPQLTEAWKGLVKDKGDETLNLNLPLGYKSPEAKNYLIKGVPRIIVIDKEGKVVDANAKRPSDPKLRALLDSLL